MTSPKPTPPYTAQLYATLRADPVRGLRIEKIGAVVAGVITSPSLSPSLTYSWLVRTTGNQLYLLEQYDSGDGRYIDLIWVQSAREGAEHCHDRGTGQALYAQYKDHSYS